ncbi:unnamed protein product [Porites lobata]|uniref:Ferric-chelate reductase 1 n=1 Tax=Porites lobata TaxID=104759 RepID=A0ABN8N864_9CNID|nr:unnamed protein product [Porites lobata]
MALTTMKQLLSTLLLLSLSSELCALTFTAEGCGETKGCYASPASCTTSEDCDFLVTYNATNSTHVEFELSGKGDWIAVGFSDDRLMANTDILMCVNNQALRGHYYATGRTIPQRTNPTPAAVQIIEQADENNIIKCRISREVNPIPAIANFTDLNQEVFLLAAYGNVDGSMLQYHGNGRGASPLKIRVTQANSTVTNGSQVNPSTEAPTMQQGSFRFPDNCQDANCDFLVTYQASGEDSVVFELRGRGEWAGVGFSGDNQMPDTDILICSSDTSLSGHYYASSRTAPTITDPTPSAVVISHQPFNNGVVSCRITRELNPGIANFRNLEEPQFLLGAIGSLSGSTIGIHAQRRATSSKVDVRSGEDGTGSGITSQILAHGIMMTLAWVLFAFVGLFTARYMREVWEPRKLLGEKAWFTVHRSLMTITLLLTISATILIFVHIGGWSSGAGPHPYLGIVAIAFAIVQPIMAAFRPHPGAPRRNIFNWSHRIVGTIALVMAVVSIYYGLCTQKVQLGKQGLWAVIAFYIGEFLIFLFELYLILSKRNKEKNSVSMGNTRDIPMEAPGHQTQPQTEMSMKEAMIRSFMFVFVTLHGASVALTIILLLVLN